MTAIRAMIQQAWETMREFGPEIVFSVPGVKHYDNPYYSNRPFSFAHLSVTGEACACRCAHCEGKLLQTMIGATCPEAMRRAVDKRVYQVLIDVIGDENTIRRVCRLDRKPGDYLQSMLYCRDAGLNIAPHIVIGLHFGQIRGEEWALEMIRQADPETIVLVILTPACGTAMAGIQPPAMDEAARIMATARILNPATPITLGCARPPGKYKRRVERIAMDCGVNGIAYPDETTVDYARRRGLKKGFSEECCSLLGRRWRNHSGR